MEAMKQCSRKTCRRVGEFLLLSEFSKKCDTRDGRRYECRECQRGYNTPYQAKKRKAANKPVREYEPKGWPVPSPPPLDEQILTYQLRKSWGGVTRSPSFAAVL